MNHAINTVDSVLSEKISAIKSGLNVYSTGSVRLVREYIVEATGLENVSYFEKVIIGEGSEGYVDAIRQDCILIALTRIKGKLQVGDKVVSTGEEFTANYSSQSVGHIVNMFGEDCLAGKTMENLLNVKVETEAIPIMDRISVTRPLLTGITGIDLIYPIGRGQRQLIIGDKKTGKTQIALDTIYNQRDQEILCIYVAIGKTKKEVKDIYNQLLRRGAMEYTIILAAFNDDPAPVLRNTPYAALAMARTHLEQSEDVLVVIDDLKRHADVCREIALLMGKTPGRDAYPPDIFYAHSRVLEMGCQHKNGGSITILPICETRGGDITDYISTNIISITDGQIVLSAKSFEKGQKPAINYGLSVSRLGGAVQEAAMKRTGPPIRRELLAYLEQREIFELANIDEMGESMKRSMIRGARILDMLKQHKYAIRTSKESLTMVQNLDRGE
ncbi:F0F1 ATP synthase subunit alpha [Chakrabartyella piscis]|uniref:F0F1 ATP synthase subunit alpha n=1 Tax=Chakrabartyella piscis TaxID=2918914 RepID=UPI00295887DC|nr:F0F1 ATP synthase subunit alpha [Chakrabartyella piscis]